MHLRKFWEILRAHPAADPLSSLPEAPQMKQLVTRLILATDVAKHFQGLERLRQIGSSCDPLSEEDRLVRVRPFSA